MVTPIPARVVTIRVVSHTRPTNVRLPNAADNYLGYVKGPDVNMLRGGAIVVKFARRARQRRGIPGFR